MPAIIQKLDPDTWERLHELALGTHLHHECYGFAIAMQRGLGWPMVGLIHQETIVHVGVRRPDGKIHDVRGSVTEKEFAKPFLPAHSYTLQEVTEKNLRTVRPVHESLIANASRVASALWPELPWSGEILRHRVRRFAAALEALSREHGLWIVERAAGCPTFLAESVGDEIGYISRPTDDGRSYTINRCLPGESKDNGS